jgi:hypothetical protein
LEVIAFARFCAGRFAAEAVVFFAADDLVDAADLVAFGVLMRFAVVLRAPVPVVFFFAPVEPVLFFCAM